MLMVNLKGTHVQYIKISDGYIAVDDDFEIKKFSIEITEDMEKYNMISLFEDRVKEAKESMDHEGYDLVAVFDYTPSPWNWDNREVVLQRVLSFAKKGSWKFVANKEECE